MNNLVIDPFFTPATLAASLWPSGYDKWIPQKHLLYASVRIANAIAKGNGRLIVSMPPRHGKTRLITETTIPWYIQKYPGRHTMLLSYNQEFADEVGGKAKDIITKRGDLFGYKIRADRSRVEQFETNTGSIVRFAGINGGQTGKGAHLIVIDDYIKGIDQALSATERENMWHKFLANIFSRKEPGCTVIIVATRWHSDDLIGRILSKTKDKWEYICFPAICEADGDILGRKKGDVLFPERYPIETLDEIRSLETGTTIFEALYQQQPIDANSEFANAAWLKKIEAGNRWLEELTEVRAWDFAKTEGAGDHTCGTKAGRKGLTRNMFIRNVVKAQLSPAKIEALIRRVAVADGTGVPILLEQEPGSQAAGLVEHYKKNVLPEFTVLGIPAGNKSKIHKAQPFLAAAESGCVFLEEGPWNHEFTDSFGKFPPPSGHGDEEVDTASMCYNHLFQVNLAAPVWGRGVKVEDPEGLRTTDDIRKDIDRIFPVGGAPKKPSMSGGVVWGRRR